LSNEIPLGVLNPAAARSRAESRPAAPKAAARPSAAAPPKVVSERRHRLWVALKTPPWKHVDYDEVPKEKAEKKRGEKRSFRLSEKEVMYRFRDLWDLIDEIEPDMAKAREEREQKREKGDVAELLASVWDFEVIELAERLARLWRFFRSSGFDAMKFAHEQALLHELQAIRRGLLWHKWLAQSEKRDLANWNKAIAWVEADDSEYEAELLKTLSMSAPQREEESMEDYVSRLRTIRSALAKTPTE
jgi:hypothetical protein